MNIIELFAGTKSFATIADIMGHSTFTSDFDKQFDKLFDKGTRLLSKITSYFNALALFIFIYLSKKIINTIYIPFVYIYIIY